MSSSSIVQSPISSSMYKRTSNDAATMGCAIIACYERKQLTTTITARQRSFTPELLLPGLHLDDVLVAVPRRTHAQSWPSACSR